MESIKICTALSALSLHYKFMYICSEAFEDTPEVQIITEYCGKIEFPTLTEVNECFSK